MSSCLLLDTCAAIWISSDERIAADADDAIKRSLESGKSIFVSPITAWEIGILSSRGRIKLPMNPVRWFARLIGAPGLRLAAMEPDILITSSLLPGMPPRDPADRIIVATAREHDYCVVTRDRGILDYADQGHCHALAC